jgi:hypothetical protein
MSQPTRHGGARPGAGRKPVDTVERRVRLPRDVAALLVAIGNGRLRDGIVFLARRYRAGAGDGHESQN